MARRRRAPKAEAVAGERGVAIAGDVVGSLIVTGDDVSVELKVGPESGALIEQVALLQRPTIRKSSPPPPPRPSPDRLDRVEEVADALRAVPDGPVNVHGEAGIGKTYVLRDVAANAPGDLAKDGVAYLFARGRSRDDLLYDVFDAFHTSTPAAKPSTAQILRAMGRRKPLLLLDSLELEREEAQALASSLPECAVVAASRQRVLWEGHPLPLAGLALNDAVALVERELGRPVSPDEQPGVEWLWRTLEGHPLRLRQAAAVARERGLTLTPPAPGAGAAPGREPAGEALSMLDGDERMLLAALVVLGGADIGSERLGRLVAQGDAAVSLEKLRQLGLIEERAGRVRVWEDLVADPAPVAELLPDAAERLVDSLLWWLRELPPPDEMARELPALAAAVAIARRTGRPAQAVELGRAVDPMLALSGHWDAWEDVLETALAAARGLGDRAGEAWALHQLGTRAACLGSRAAAAAALGEALELRRELGDELGAHVTADNLEVGLGRAGLLTRAWNRRLYTASVPVVLGAIAVVFLLLGGGAVALALADGDDGATTATLAVSFAGEGTGSVTIEPPGVTCSQPCQRELETETPLTLRAAPAGGSTFAGWSGCPAVDAGACIVTLAGDLAVTARFALRASETRELTVNAVGGRVTSDDGTVDCTSTCTHALAEGTTVTLMAKPNEEFAFDRWDGCDSEPGGACQVSLATSRVVTAVFRSAPTNDLTVTVDPAGGGSVTGGAGTIACTTSCTVPVPEGTAATLTASPSEGFEFDRWEGCDAEPGGACEVRLGSDREVTAFFRAEPQTETLTVALASRNASEDKVGGSVAGGNGAIDCRPTCTAPFPAGEMVALTATPNSVSVFDSWRGCDAASGVDCEVTLDAPRDVTAVFRYPSLELDVSGGTITYGPDDLECPDACTAGFSRGRVVTLTATPDDSSGEFTMVTWGGACSGIPEGATTCTITVGDDTSVSADISVSG